MSERLDHLLAGMCHGELALAERHELEHLLEYEPGALSAAHQQWRLHRRLPLALRGPSGDWFVSGVVATIRRDGGERMARSASTPGVRRPHRRPLRRTAVAWRHPALAVLAALLLIVCGVWWSANTQRAAPTPEGVAVHGSGRLLLRDGLWHLDAGHIELIAERRARSLTFATPHARVSIVGTRFTLTVVAATTLVVVSEGTVRVAFADDVVEVSTGESLRTDGVRVVERVQRQPPNAPAISPAPPSAAPSPIWHLVLPTQPDPAWRGVPYSSGGMRSVDNPLNPGTAVVLSPRLADGPLLTPAHTLQIAYESLATAERPGAVWMLIQPATGAETTCQATLTFAPGRGSAQITVRSFHDGATGAAVDLMGARVLRMGVLGWGGGVDDMVWRECRWVGRPEGESR